MLLAHTRSTTTEFIANKSIFKPLVRPMMTTNDPRAQHKYFYDTPEGHDQPLEFMRNSAGNGAVGAAAGGGLAGRAIEPHGEQEGRRRLDATARRPLRRDEVDQRRGARGRGGGRGFGSPRPVSRIPGGVPPLPPGPRARVMDSAEIL